MGRTELTGPLIVEEWLGKWLISAAKFQRTKRQPTSLPSPIESEQQQAEIPLSKQYERILRSCDAHLVAARFFLVFCSFETFQSSLEEAGQDFVFTRPDDYAFGCHATDKLWNVLFKNQDEHS